MTVDRKAGVGPVLGPTPVMISVVPAPPARLPSETTDPRRALSDDVGIS
ncbi:hypothetical protein [Haloechinothrix halophila]|nr:hypothetical protein [Haloechinothrix halophila]